MSMYFTIITVAFLSIIAAIFLVLRASFNKIKNRPFIKELDEAGITWCSTEEMIARGTVWNRRGKLLTEWETDFFHELLRKTDADRWYLCPQVRVSDIVQISSSIRPRGRAWWKLFNLVSEWNCDVVIVDRKNFEIVAAVELVDRAYNKPARRRRDILLKEVMRQADITLLQSYDREELQEQILSFLSSRHTTTPAPL